MNESGLPAPRKRFGQHFLHDPGVIRRIVGSLLPSTTALVEIGPGRGAITRPLLEQFGRLTAVELDRDLAQFLRDTLTGQGLTVVEADALKLDWAELLGVGPVSIVGNLPYNVATEIIFRLLDHGSAIEEMVFMVQREVAQRLVANPGSGSYGRLSVMVQYHCEASLLFHIGPGAFNPPPKVDSAMVRLRPCTPRHAAHNLLTLRRLVLLAFQSRRKTLRNALKEWCPAELMQELGIDPNARAETIDVAAYVRLANALDAPRN